MTGPVELVALTREEAQEVVEQLARAALRLAGLRDEDGAAEAALAAQRLRERIQRPGWVPEGRQAEQAGLRG